jgi:rhodanese-related sulfurtransferase
MTTPVPAIAVADLPGSAVLLDVRENDEWAAGHAPTAYLKQAGWDAVNVEGGMRAWAAAGRPMAADSNVAPRVL